jgi:hypothetical protein
MIDDWGLDTRYWILVTGRGEAEIPVQLDCWRVMMEA